MGWATFLAIFLQTHLVTLLMGNMQKEGWAAVAQATYLVPETNLFSAETRKVQYIRLKLKEKKPLFCCEKRQ
jgi:hypothetical protein